MRKFTMLAFVPLLCLFPKANFAFYPPNLGAAASFVFFTPIGAVSNTGTSYVTGNIGNNTGAISGFGTPTTYNGTTHTADLVSWQAVYDISLALGQLKTEPSNGLLDGAIGAGQTIAPGVHNFVGACNIAGSLVLDGGGDTNAVFIFQVNGALNTVAGSTITLVNGASASNVFWAANGAGSLGANSNFSGTIIAYGAISIGAGSFFTGRALSTTGAVSVNTITANIPDGPSITTVQPNCSGALGTVTINAPVGAGYTYSLGGAFQSSATFTNLAAGTYPITVKNGSGTIISSGISTVINPQYQPSNPYNLGGAGNFVLFSSLGAVSNTSNSDIENGDIGTYSGAVSGMGSPTMVAGTTHNADGAAAKAKNDLANVYTLLQNQAPTGTFPAAPVDGQVFAPGVYNIGAASALGGNLILDGGGNASALFVFQIGGALTSGAGSSVILINGATPSRVFWVVDGAAAMAANTTFIGTIVNNAAISFGDGSILNGRALSTNGAVSIYGTLVYAPFNCYAPPAVVLPVTFGTITAVAKNCNVYLSFEVPAQQNNKQFEVEHTTLSGGDWATLAILPADAQGTTAKTYQYTHTQPSVGTNYYRIKQVDLDGRATYSATCTVQSDCNGTGITSYPNPVQNKLTVSLSAGMDNPTIRICNALGQIIYSQPGHAAENTISTTQFVAGFYLLQVVSGGKIVYRQTIIKN